ncbi:MAG: hypothetical protein VKI82_11510, partial [Leptolyngbya sp.]|nr:hypothetical protein [Leptolyngbya sp.]
MQNPQTASTAELEGVGPRSNYGSSIVLAQVYPLAPLNSSGSETVILSTEMDDYRPVDNHRALVNGWKRLSPAQQWLTGGCIGLTLGFGLITWVTSLQKAMAFTPVPLGDAKTIGRTQSALKMIYQRLGEVRAPLIGPESVTPPSAVQPLLQPVMMDRFYLPIPATTADPAVAPQAAMVVDRFYFDPHQSVEASPEQAPAPNSGDQPLVVPLPPPHPQAFAQTPEAGAAMANRSPNPTIPSPS